MILLTYPLISFSVLILFLIILIINFILFYFNSSSFFFFFVWRICYNFKNSKIKRWEGEGLVTKILLTRMKKKGNINASENK